MELKDFVKTTIQQIVEGVSEAQEAVKAAAPSGGASPVAGL